MTGENLTYVLLAGLAIGLLHAAYTDIKRREIEHYLNAAIALSAPLLWWATGMAIWPDIAIQIGLAFGIFAFFILLQIIGAMGGGDVKLLGALALWFPWETMVMLIIIMSIIGGLLTLFMAMVHKIRRSPGKLEIPYGIAIASAGIWVIAERYINHFTS